MRFDEIKTAEYFAKQHDKKQIWQEIQAKSPHLAEFLKAINACGLGKSTIKWVKFNEEYRGKR